MRQQTQTIKGKKPAKSAIAVVKNYLSVTRRRESLNSGSATQILVPKSFTKEASPLLTLDYSSTIDMFA